MASPLDLFGASSFQLPPLQVSTSLRSRVEPVVSPYAPATQSASFIVGGAAPGGGQGDQLTTLLPILALVGMAGFIAVKGA